MSTRLITPGISLAGLATATITASPGTIFIPNFKVMLGQYIE